MKRILIASILGVASFATDSRGAGHVIFSTYFSSSAMLMAMTYGGQPVSASAGYSAELYYGLGAGLTFNQLTPIPSSVTSVGSVISGIILGPIVTLPDWTSGPVTFGIQLIGSGYSSNPYPTWTEPGSNITPDLIPPNVFTISAVAAAFPSTPSPFLPVSFVFAPEPGTVALVGMGLVAALRFARRR